jgi:putative addiction module component (TIGR02574 family)
MNKSLLLDELMQLSPADRMDIVDQLWDSIHPPGSARPGEFVEFTDEQMAEIRERVAEHQRNPGSALPWEEVRARLRARLK